MKRLLIPIALCAALSLQAQTRQEFKERYDRQVSGVGTAGVGVEYILDRWAETFPEDCDMLDGRFNYYYAKSRSTEVKEVKARKYLGKAPVFSLKDSLGRDVNYFYVPVFDDSLFRLAQKSADKAIALEPARLITRLNKISSLIDYEKDSPDMGATMLLDLIDCTISGKFAWKFNGSPVSKDDFGDAVHAITVTLYGIGSANAYEAFRLVSEKMIKYDKKNSLFHDNIGAYWLVAREDYKKAGKAYEKALKLNPDDEIAKANMKLIEKLKNNGK